MFPTVRLSGKYESSIMAITKVAGEILESNLIRTSDLAFNTNLLYVDVTNGRIGVKTDSPGNFALDVNGNARIRHLLYRLGYHGKVINLVVLHHREALQHLMVLLHLVY